MKLPPPALLAVALFGFSNHAHAEGTSDLGPIQGLRGNTTIQVDILNFATESISWEGSFVEGTAAGNGGLHPVDVDVYDPAGAYLGRFASGSVVVPMTDGTYEFRIVEDWGDTNADSYTDPISHWEIVVSGATMGRVWSDEWRFNALGFSIDESFNGSFFAVVDGGGPGHDSVVELKAEGMAGFIWFINANREGIPGASGRSMHQDDVLGVASDYPLYLNPPESAGYNPLIPNVTSTGFGGSALCEAVSFGVAEGTVSFESNIEGTYHLICDLNQDGLFDPTSDVDFHILGDAVVGTNAVVWDGSDNLGAAVGPGSYDCQVKLTVGEFHYVAHDIETSFEGFRLFEVDSALGKTGLNMFWNDAQVASLGSSLSPMARAPSTALAHLGCGVDSTSISPRPISTPALGAAGTQIAREKRPTSTPTPGWTPTTASCSSFG